MQKKQFVVITLITTVITILNISACMVRKSEPITQRSFAPEEERVANGERVFMMNCQKCHPGGESGLGPAINSNPAPQFVKRFQMRHGLGVMPPFHKGEISKRDMHDISKYLHAWKHY